MNLQELAARGPIAVGSKIDQYLARMDADTRALASKLLMDKAYSAPEVAEALTGSDYPVGRSAVGDWRRAHKVGQ